MSRQKKRHRADANKLASVERPAPLPVEVATEFDANGEELEAWLAEEVSHAPPSQFNGPPLLVLDNRPGRKRWRRET